ncbi:essential MCU regulator, mitochondrial [Patagioenas fasciata monilis]|uniref:Essential MCU regulator, mitochondrial n=1 Tax=Patagioenas fasciata monilis TaxID=372326 RepID=A0A1V4JAG2_PATFA|nr:essential MCU regulator, mitochondrial [Patagioenas fasciata monilis]
MAAAGGRLLAVAAAYSGRVGWRGLRRSPAVPLVPSRSATATRSGAILPKPVKTPFGLLRRMMMTMIKGTVTEEQKGESH